jgi:hypothetical protein
MFRHLFKRTVVTNQGPLAYMPILATVVNVTFNGKYAVIHATINGSREKITVIASMDYTPAVGDIIEYKADMR